MRSKSALLLAPTYLIEGEHSEEALANFSGIIFKAIADAVKAHNIPADFIGGWEWTLGDSGHTAAKRCDRCGQWADEDILAGHHTTVLLGGRNIGKEYLCEPCQFQVLDEMEALEDRRLDEEEEEEEESTPLELNENTKPPEDKGDNPFA